MRDFLALTDASGHPVRPWCRNASSPRSWSPPSSFWAAGSSRACSC